MLENRTKEKLLDGKLAVGCFVRSPDPTLAEFVASAGWDFLVFDEEHGSVDRQHVADLARACERRGVTPIVRVSSADPALALRCLDSGAAGLHFPWINDAEQARAAVSVTKYGPAGRRGLAGNRSTDWSVSADSIAQANANTLVVIQIETIEAVDNIEELCTVVGVDVCFIGPSDLSQSLGVPGELGHPLVADAMKRVADVVTGSDKILGVFTGSADAASRAIELGARYVATGMESILGRGMRSFLQTMSHVP